jgi:hypothetical protein
MYRFFVELEPRKPFVRPSRIWWIILKCLLKETFKACDGFVWPRTGSSEGL